ncbi:MgtC/SapB family protein [Aeromicrobium sp. YIM 150415]|nr:MgtC/SapB family protein [Aeromicrobium sp. YIM 150415]
MSSVSISDGQGWLQVGELVLAFVLSSLIGLERQLRGKSAGLRTQAIVGTASALFLLVSKYGFMNVLGDQVVLDPSRVAAQIVSGLGFLGAGLILTRRGRVSGLTTAASVWETAAIGMAAAAGLWVLALVVTALHFLVVYGFTALTHRLPGSRDSQIQIEVVYEDGRGLLREVLPRLTSGGWTVSRVESHGASRGTAALTVELNGPSDDGRLVDVLTRIDGVRSVQILAEDDRE